VLRATSDSFDKLPVAGNQQYRPHLGINSKRIDYSLKVVTPFFEPGGESGDGEN
jgi:hypothetical protein